MEYKITKLQNDKGLDIDIVNIINSNNYSFSFYTYGGYMSEVCIPISSNVSETEDVLLGYGNLDDCLEAHGYFNSIIGRVCNRIGQSKFTLNGKEYNLYSNTEPDHLHGGEVGFNKKIWKIADIKKTSQSIKVELTYQSKHCLLYTSDAADE